MCKFLQTDDLGVIYERIAGFIHYYNHHRLHTAIKTTPYAQFLKNKKCLRGNKLTKPK